MSSGRSFQFIAAECLKQCDDEDIAFILSSPINQSINQSVIVVVVQVTRAALIENNEASAKLTTANGGTFTPSSARLGSQSRYSALDQLTDVL